MTDFTPTHVHKVTGEKFRDVTGGVTHRWIYGTDESRERRKFEYGMLTPIQPVKAWEPCFFKFDVPFKPEIGIEYRLTQQDGVTVLERRKG